MKRYRGVDLHRTQFTVCTRLENGRTYLRQWPIRELKLFAVQLRKDDELAVEATSNTRLFYDAVVEKVARVVVVNPSQFKVISESVKKTDRNDAETLALYLSKDLLPEVRMKERSQREMSHLAQTRDLLVKQRSALKTKINNLLSAEGINLKKEALSSNKALERVLALPLSPVLAAEARVLVANTLTNQAPCIPVGVPSELPEKGLDSVDLQQIAKIDEHTYLQMAAEDDLGVAEVIAIDSSTASLTLDADCSDSATRYANAYARLLLLEGTLLLSRRLSTLRPAGGYSRRPLSCSAICQRKVELLWR